MVAVMGCAVQSAKFEVQSLRSLRIKTWRHLMSDSGGAGGASHLRRGRSLAGRTLPVDQSQGGALQLT